ncbi:MAG TPA: PAS domain S-box protein, partial [Flavisolibacter sp.]|nr:PAS domain S-box protein [Flavisolibacter sp.]
MLTAFLENHEFLAHPQTRLLDDHPLPIWIIDAATLHIKYSNRSSTAYYGFSIEEFDAKRFTDLFTSDGRFEFFHRVSLDNVNQLNGTYRHVKKNGDFIVVELFTASFSWENKNYCQVTAVDVTAKDLLQHELIESRRRYKTFIEHSSEGIYCQEFKKPILVDHTTEEILAGLKKDGYISECNNAMAKMYGYEVAGELLGSMAEQLLDFNDEANIEFFRKFINNGFTISNTESIEKDRYGNAHYFLNNAIGIIENGYLVRIWGTQREITQNKKLLDRTSLLSNLVEQTSDILIASDLDFKPVTWNKSSEKAYGLTAEQAIGKDLRQFMNIQFHDVTRDEVVAILKRNGEWRGEIFFPRPTDHQLVTLLISIKLRVNDQNTPLGYIISGTDITERKNSELILKESENRFRDLADSAPVMIWISDKEDKITYVNKPWVKFTGVDLARIRDMGWMELLHKDDVLKARQTFN